MTPKKITVLIFILTVAWISFLTQGLPIGDPDDWDHMLAAQDVPWDILVKNTTLPISTSVSWVGQSDRFNEVTSRRVFLTVVLKSIAAFFDLRAFPYYFFSKALFFGGILVMLFALLFQSTKSYLWALLGSLFYFLIPVHYPHLLWVTDPAVMVHFFVLGGFFAYWKIVQNIQEKGSSRSFYGALLILLVSGWLGLKTKEPAFILPLTLSLYTTFNLWKWQKLCKRSLWLIPTLGLHLLLIIPIQHLGAPSQHKFKFSFETFSRMLFRNYQCGYQDEAQTAFLSWAPVFPVSVARNIGFFLLWTLIAFLGLYLFVRFTKTHEKAPLFLQNKLTQIMALWALLELPFMGAFQPDPRYFSGFFIPLTFLMIYFIHCVTRQWKGRWQKLLRLVALMVMLLTVANNFYHVIWLRSKIGARVNRFSTLARAIYEDALGKKNPTDRELGLFYSAQWVPDPNIPRLGNYTYYVDLGYQEWNRNPGGDLTLYEQAAKQGYIYYATFQIDSLRARKDVSLLKSISGINKQSLVERLIYRFTNPPDPFEVYKWKPSKS